MMQQNLSLQDLVDEVDTPRVRKAGPWRIVVAGEFESGKSSVINALLRAPVLPCNPGLIARPAIKITHAAAKSIDIESSDGKSATPVSLNAVLNDTDLASCHVKLPLGMLQGIEIFEVPFHHDGGIAPSDLELIGDADLIVWVTIASQAWRLSEKAIIESLPWHARDKSILAISRADKLKASEDLDKIEIRLQEDASQFFSEIVFIQASTDKLHRAVSDTRAWEETGGAALASIAHELVVTPMNAARMAGE
jgi:tRNA U34 5-carboxymethylaminomethyl modifying GTPase MnmE/TrmE